MDFNGVLRLNNCVSTCIFLERVQNFIKSSKESLAKRSKASGLTLTEKQTNDRVLKTTNVYWFRLSAESKRKDDKYKKLEEKDGRTELFCWPDSLPVKLGY